MINAAASSRKQEIFTKAVDYIAQATGVTPRAGIILGMDGRPLAPSGNYGYRKSAAKRTGSMKNWIPTRYSGTMEESRERRQIVERSIDLVNSDPNAAGVVDTYATTVVGSGLTPHPLIDGEELELSKDEVRMLQKKQLSVYRKWQSQADASQRLSFGQIQHICMRSTIQYGEYLVLLPMIDSPQRKYSLACQMINPLRLSTPTDLSSCSNIIDGIEVGEYGEPVAYWIQKSVRKVGRGSTMAVTSNDYLRVPAKIGHRWNVLHGFITLDAEQYRGFPMFTPAMKMFRDFGDLLDAELVSNIVTAAFSMFVEVQSGADPLGLANNMLSLSGENVDVTNQKRYQELEPGIIMYGNTGEKPHPIAAARPGTTFEPFTTIIKKAISMAANIPYPVLFKDPSATNFAGFRSAMLDAWRVFMMRRVWLGQDCQKVWQMLQEEAYLRGEFSVRDYYLNEELLTRAEWRGSPKGDIEPIKAAQADILLVQNNLKTRTACAAERGDDWRATADQLAEEEEMMAERGLGEEKLKNPEKLTDTDLDESGEENELNQS
ncbi:MAG: phage portal protein [Smithella sp.]